MACERESEARHAAAACSATSGTMAPRFLRYAATASSSGPLPGTTTRLPAIGRPDLTSACSPPAPATCGSVQPGTAGSARARRSRAPTRRTSMSNAESNVSSVSRPRARAPRRRARRRSALRSARPGDSPAPDLPARRGIVVDDRDALARSRTPGAQPRAPPVRRRPPRRRSYPSVRISMPGRQGTWQLRTCGRPSTVTRHSKQMPIPQSGPRGSPVTERRKP